MPEFVLYHGWTSSASRKVRLCMAEKGLEYDGKHIELLSFEHHSDWFKKLNPSGKVPALLIDGVPYVESNVINEYLDDAYPDPPLMPADPRQRYEVRLFSIYIDGTCLPAVQKHNWMRRMRPVAMKWSDEELEARLAAIPTEERRKVWYKMARDPYTDEELQTALDVLIDMTDRIEAGVRDGDWIVGNAYSLADIAAVPYVRRVEEIAPDALNAARRPGVADWWARIKARPAYAKAHIGGYDEQSDPDYRPPTA